MPGRDRIGRCRRILAISFNRTVLWLTRKAGPKAIVIELLVFFT